MIYIINGKEYAGVTDENGVIEINTTTNAVVELKYAGNDTILPANLTLVLKDPVRIPTVIVGKDYTQYAVDAKAGERGNYLKIQLFDEKGNALSNKTVLFGFNGHLYVKTTDEAGWAQLQINLKQKGWYTFAVGFLGDDNYTGSMDIYLITIKQKPVTINAAAKSFKATAKTKKYTVTLKTEKCASIDGKAYFGAGKKVTMKLNGKTYTAKTNAKGQATFALKITKKGKFTASIKYAGDNTYKSASKKVKITIK